MIQAKISFIILLLIQILKYVGANQQSNCQQLFSQKSLVPSQSECLINQGDPSSLTDNTVEFSNNLKGLVMNDCISAMQISCNNNLETVLSSPNCKTNTTFVIQKTSDSSVFKVNDQNFNQYGNFYKWCNSTSTRYYRVTEISANINSNQLTIQFQPNPAYSYQTIVYGFVLAIQYQSKDEQEQQEQAHFQTLPQLQFLNEDQQPKVSVSTPPLTNQNIPRQLSQNDPFQNSLNEMQSIQSNQRIQKTLDVKQKRDKIQQLYNQQNLRKSSFHNLSQNQIEGKQNQINKQSIFNQGDNNQQKTSQNEIIDNLGCQEDQINKQSKDQEQQGQAQFLTSPKIQLVDDDQELKVSEFEQPQINQNIQCQKSQDDSFSKSPKEIQSIGSNQGYQKVFKMKGKVAKFQELQNYENGLQIIKQNSDLDQNENHLFNTQKTSQNEIIENQDHSTYNTDEKLRFKSGSNLINIKNSCFLNIGISQIDILLNVPSNKPLIIQISQFLTQLGQIIETLPQQKNRYMHDSYLLIILLKYISASQYTDCQQYLSHWGFVPSQSECLINQGSPGSLTNNTVEFNNNIKGLLNNDCINAMQFACPNYYFNVLSSPNCKSDTNFVIQKTSQNLILKIRLYIRIIVNSGQQISASSVYQVNNQNFTDKGYSQTFCNSTYYYRETVIDANINSNQLTIQFQLYSATIYQTSIYGFFLAIQYKCPDFCDQCLDVGCIKCSPAEKIISQVCPEEQIKKQARDQQEYQEQAQVQNPPQLQFLNEGQQPKVSVSTPPLINQNIPCQLSQNGQFQNSPNEMQSIQSNQRIQKIIDVKQKRDKFKQLFNQEKQSESSFKSLSQNQIEGQQNQITKQSIFDQDEKNQQKTSQNQIIENLGYHEDQINKQSKDQECQDQAHFQTSPQKQQVNDDKELRVSESEKPQINQNIESQKSQNCSFSKSPKETLSVELNQRYQKTFKVKGKGAKFQELQNFENELQIKKQKSSHDQNENILFTTQKTSQNEIIENQDHPTQATDENFQSGQTAYLNIDEIPQIPTTSDSFKISIESIFSRSFKA
ncbi:hypothetical protein ABPG74_017951 [Tetrahymena malaccensis]